jgi:transcriptional regulator with XRE-family HTH domain
MAPKSIAESEAITRQLNDEMPLQQLRHALMLTQEQLGATMGVTQAAISKLESQEDMLIGTLERIVEAMGGELELRAHFPSGHVTLTHIGGSRKRITTESASDFPEAACAQ